MAVVTAACVGQQTCNIEAKCTTFHEKLQGPGAFCWDVEKRFAAKVTCSKQQQEGDVIATPSTEVAAVVGDTTSSFLADFGKEFQGTIGVCACTRAMYRHWQTWVLSLCIAVVGMSLRATLY